MVEKDGKCWSPTHGKVVQCSFGCGVLLTSVPGTGNSGSGSWKLEEKKMKTGTVHMFKLQPHVDTRKNIPKRTNM